MVSVSLFEGVSVDPKYYLVVLLVVILALYIMFEILTKDTQQNYITIVGIWKTTKQTLK